MVLFSRHAVLLGLERAQGGGKGGARLGVAARVFDLAVVRFGALLAAGAGVVVGTGPEGHLTVSCTLVVAALIVG